MAVVELLDLPSLLGPSGALAGLDLGEKTIGVAVSDPGRMVASPLSLIRRRKFNEDANALFELMDARSVAGVARQSCKTSAAMGTTIR